MTDKMHTPLLCSSATFSESNLLFQLLNFLLDFLLQPFTLIHLHTNSLVIDRTVLQHYITFTRSNSTNQRINKTITQIIEINNK